MSSTKLTCPSCGARRGDSAICPVCGYAYDERIESETQQPVKETPKLKQTAEPKNIQFCPQCGKQIHGTPKFCEQCGTNLEAVRHGAPVSSAQAPKQLSNKTLYMAFGAIAVLAGIVILATWLFRDKPAATAEQQNAPEQQQAQPQVQQPAKPAPTPEQLEAIKRYNKALADNPSDTNALVNLANVYYDVDDYQNAIPYYRQYIQSNSHVPNVLVDYAYCLFRNGQTQDAITEMKEAIKVDPKFQQAYFNLSIVNLSSGNTEEGMEWMKKCIAVDSTSNIAQEAKNLLANHSQLFQQQQQQ
jgi:tetratricopeptide (TPR) repeat protein